MNVSKKLLIPVLCVGLLGAAPMEAMSLKKWGLISLGSLAVGAAGSWALHLYEKNTKEKVEEGYKKLEEIDEQEREEYKRQLERERDVLRGQLRTAQERDDKLVQEMLCYANSRDEIQVGEDDEDYREEFDDYTQRMEELRPEYAASLRIVNNLRQRVERKEEEIALLPCQKYKYFPVPEYTEQKEKIEKLEQREKIVSELKGLPFSLGLCVSYAAFVVGILGKERALWLMGDVFMGPLRDLEKTFGGCRK